ncbi:hypothetical protein [Bradyrhizobium sp.]|uniref:hypothetical protein n=1 Tax=Bradyrhizobium sp. TaxID=376 RepID=UPI001D99A30A|nr:hypothetical protein [Bradyrhizobium sp.]MBV8701951.1 hypothetical protein [Bradyrhizobium sp.]MBV8920726.1 hypothetical protein [Bradyrhizobium sp.]MBV9983500.1 hypothetical protein [Bradyrhizobium sp.]
MNAKSKDKSKPRKAMTRVELEQALADAVRASHPECEGLVAVLVERVVPPWPDAANWAVKGVRYGKADRKRCGSVLADVVAARQQEFELSEGPA